MPDKILNGEVKEAIGLGLKLRYACAEDTYLRAVTSSRNTLQCWRELYEQFVRRWQSQQVRQRTSCCGQEEGVASSPCWITREASEISPKGKIGLLNGHSELKNYRLRDGQYLRFECCGSPSILEIPED